MNGHDIKRRLVRHPLTHAGPSVSAVIVPQRLLPFTDLLVLEFFVATGVAVETSLNGPRWYGVAAGAAVALAFVTRIRGWSMPRWASERLGFWYERRRRKRSAGGSDPFDAEQSDGSRIGFQWDGKVLISVVRVQENSPVMTVLEPAVTPPGETVSAQLLADSLVQFDIRLDSIDVISQGARLRRRGQIGSVYEAVLGPLPAVAQRSVLVTVRLDPTLCPDAVRNRGGGWQAIVRTAATATRRVANRLSDAGLRAQIMTADEIMQATSEMSHGINPSAIEETWRACRTARLELRSYLLKPAMLATDAIGLLCAVPSDSTTVCISLRRDERNGLIKVRGLVRFDGQGQPRVQPLGLGRLAGRQYAALISSLPLPSPRRSVPNWYFRNGVEALGDLELSVSGCGQVVGADEHGRAVAVALFGPSVSRVEICGTLHLAQQVVLRSSALGAWVRVQTRRPVAWRGMVQQVGDPSLLSVNDSDVDSMSARSDRDYGIEMFDGVADPAVRDGVTTMVVRAPHAEPSTDADVTLRLLDHNRDLLQVCTRSASAMVTMVATPDEMRYIKSSLGMSD
ncbi:type VII secretion protein EccE [Mycobacterium sp. 1482292.6]|uniref:type VII secretion protein EccE n=1 Tax=Mycobacterium sp. 1482292.6 TaxID=1834081 RepID=UPI000A749191|nr:type VII secretion protein EccE [Mycobacterium sp. 1482292.6]